MTDTAATSDWLIAGSILMALAASVVPLPAALALYQPEWLALLVVYWCLSAPQRFGPGRAWICGLLTDAVRGTLLGQHALALVLLSALTLHFRLRFRVFPLVQQSFTVAALLALHAFVLFWIDGVADVAGGGLARVWPVLISALLWPPLVLLLDHLRASSGNGERAPG